MDRRPVARVLRWLWSGRPGARRPWLRRLLIVVFVPLLALPLALTLAYRFVPPPITPLEVRTWMREGTVYKVWRPIGRMSPELVRAVIGAEDSTFCSHHGFDWNAIGEAAWRNLRSRRVRGASTISQQTAKNVFLMPHRTWLRKGLETYLTVMIEALWPKRRILEIYLNEAQFGPRIFGAEAAARIYFQKTASELDEEEAARLAAVLPDPVHWRVVDPGPYVEERTELLEDRVDEVRRLGLDACIWR